MNLLELRKNKKVIKLGRNSTKIQKKAEFGLKY
jgi:hypothetical protein